MTSLYGIFFPFFLKSLKPILKKTEFLALGLAKTGCRQFRLTPVKEHLQMHSSELGLKVRIMFTFSLRA